MNYEVSIRSEVKAFASHMEAKLRENDHKGGWGDCDFGYLVKRLDEESAELRSAVSALKTALSDADAPPELVRMVKEAVRNEAADVANFAMMIADNAGGAHHVTPADLERYREMKREAILSGRLTQEELERYRGLKSEAYDARESLHPVHMGHYIERLEGFVAQFEADYQDIRPLTAPVHYVVHHAGGRRVNPSGEEEGT